MSWSPVASRQYHRVVTRLIVVRHAETEWNVSKRLQGTHESPLTPRGRQQAAWLAGQLAGSSLTHIHSSPSGRALATADALSRRTGIGVEPVPTLAEMDLGPWQGKTFAEVAECWPAEAHDFWHRPAAFCGVGGGESFASLRSRAAQYLASVSSLRGTACVVTHSLVAKAMWLVVDDLGVDCVWATAEFMPLEISILEHDDEWRVVTRGDTATDLPRDHARP